MSGAAMLVLDAPRRSSAFVARGLRCRWCGYRTCTRGDLKRHARERQHLGPPPPGQEWREEAKQPARKVWPPELLARAQELKREGLNSREIQPRLNSEFGLALTRLAVKARLQKAAREAQEAQEAQEARNAAHD